MIESCYQRGTRSYAVIKVEGKVDAIKTPIRISGMSGKPYAFPYPQKLEFVLTITSRDAEAHTLADVGSALEPIFQQNPHEQVTVKIFSSVGSCDGCDYRMKRFFKEYGDSAKNVSGYSYYL